MCQYYEEEISSYQCGCSFCMMEKTSYFDRHLKISLTSKKFISIIALYLIGYINLEWQWTFLLLCVWCYVQSNLEQHKKAETKMQQQQHHLPSWCLYPDTQRAEWLNLLIAQLWPCFGQCLENHLHLMAKEPSFVQKLQSHCVQSISFSRVSVGKISPRIGGIGFQNATHRDEVILDIEVDYAGDMLVEMEIQLLDDKLPSLPVSISNFTFVATKSRVHLKPLLKGKPFFGALYFSFLDVPEVDFELGGLLSKALDFPGISLLLRHIIRDYVQENLVYPRTIPLPLIDENELQELLEKKINAKGEVSPLSILPQGVLSIFVIEAKSLPRKDFKLLPGGGKSDPYVTMTINADDESHRFRSETVPNKVNPQWKMMVDVPINCIKTLQKDVELQVFDEDRVGPDELLGRCALSVRTALLYKQYQDVWEKLMNVEEADNKDEKAIPLLHCKVGWSDLKESPPVPLTSTSLLEGSQHLHLGVISIYVDSCQNLGGGRTGLKLPNAKVKVTVCNIVQMTETSHEASSHPVFEHRMNFMVKDPRSDRVEFAVMDDMRNGEVLGTVRYPISNLLAKTKLSFSHNVFPLDAIKGALDSAPQIIVSMAFRYIHRPNTSGFGSHHSLHDLPKILQKEASINSSSSSQGSPAEEVNVSVISSPKVTSTPLMGNANSASVQQNHHHHHQRSSSYPTRSSHCTPSSSPTTRRRRKLPEVETMIGKIRLSLKYSQRTATLSVIVHRIQNLQKYYQHGPNISTYVKLRLIENILPGRNHRVKHTKQRTGIPIFFFSFQGIVKLFFLFFILSNTKTFV